jgi:hypothetical protein
MNRVYFRPQFRYGAYIIGLLLGHSLFKFQEKGSYKRVGRVCLFCCCFFVWQRQICVEIYFFPDSENDFQHFRVDHFSVHLLRTELHRIFATIS